MKRTNFFGLLAGLLITLVFSGCNDSDSSNEEDSDATISIQKRGPVQLIYMNNHRSQFQFSDGWTVNIVPSTRMEIQRPSCSGFESGSEFKKSEVDFVEYTYNIADPSFNPIAKYVNATAIRIYKKGCGAEKPQYVTYLDTDKDFYADVVDAFPNDPTQH